jgi:hypothetical protein
MQPDPKEFAAGDYNLYRYCHNDPVNRNDPFGDIDKETLERLKALLRSIEKNQREDHQDRTQGIKNDGTPGKETKGSVKTSFRMSRFERDKMKTEVLPEDIDSLKGTAHYHGAPYRKVKGSDGKWHDTSLPSQEADVANLKKPMLFGSDPIRDTGKAILLEPRNGKEPLQTTIDMKYDH